MPRKMKIAVEEKAGIALRCLKGEMSIVEASRAARVDRETIRDWIRQYKAEGIEALKAHERNRTYDPELKIEAVRAYLTGEGSLQKICKKYKIRSKKQLQNWIKVYNAHGDFTRGKRSGGSHMKQGRSTTQEERIQIARECIASGKNYGDLALKYQVSYQQVRKWTLRYEELGEAGLEDRRGKRKKDQTPRTELEEAKIEIERLKHKLYLAEMERDLLNKLDEIERRDVSGK